MLVDLPFVVHCLLVGFVAGLVALVELILQLLQLLFSCFDLALLFLLLQLLVVLRNPISSLLGSSLEGLNHILVVDL